MQPDASSQRKMPVQQRALPNSSVGIYSFYQAVLLTSPLYRFVFLLLTTVSKVLDKSTLGYTRSLVVYNQHWFCPA